MIDGLDLATKKVPLGTFFVSEELSETGLFDALGI
ncbi:hypothetical protein VAA_03581 [Vibrio anguillarum 775]|nr:hypothetical protein VAA_03581 [Vibrio anguillarum 775]